MDKARQHASTTSKKAMVILNLTVLWSFSSLCLNINCTEKLWAQKSMAMQGHKTHTHPLDKDVPLRRPGMKSAKPQWTKQMLICPRLKKYSSWWWQLNLFISMKRPMLI